MAFINVRVMIVAVIYAHFLVTTTSARENVIPDPELLSAPTQNQNNGVVFENRSFLSGLYYFVFSCDILNHFVFCKENRYL